MKESIIKLLIGLAQWVCLKFVNYMARQEIEAQMAITQAAMKNASDEVDRKDAEYAKAKGDFNDFMQSHIDVITKYGLDTSGVSQSASVSPNGQSQPQSGGGQPGNPV